MKTTFLREMAGFVVLVLLQTLVLNRISVFGVAVPILYIYFLIKLPKNRNLFYVVISGFLMGLIIDIFLNTPGMNAAATTIVATLRKPLMNIFFSKVDGVVDLNVEQQVERPQLKIVPKREMLAKYGITLSEFKETMGVLLEGKPVSQVYEGDRSFDLTLRVKDNDRESMEAIGNLAIDADGQKVPLCQVADIVSSAGPHTINRENVSRKMVVSANISGRDLEGAVNEIRNTIENRIRLPEGYHVEYGGQFESAQSASRTLTLASMLSVLTIFLLLQAIPR